MPKVSVLMGVYNCADTVEKSIGSILSQTFSDWEFIICDDASIDSTAEIVKECAKKDARIRLIQNDRNHGLSYTLNRCLCVANGEYCARMDGDDLCDPGRFEKQVDFLDHHPEYGFVSSRMKRFDENGVYDIPKYIDSYEPTKKAYIKGSPFCHAPVMMRKTAYDAVNGYRDLSHTLGVEDYDLWFRLYAKGIRGYVLQEPLYSMFDGRGAAKRRTYKRRINEAWVRKEGYKAIGTSFTDKLYILKPLIIGLIPQTIYVKIRGM